MQNIIENWMKTIRNWIYVIPIPYKHWDFLSTGDISKFSLLWYLGMSFLEEFYCICFKKVGLIFVTCFVTYSISAKNWVEACIA